MTQLIENGQDKSLKIDLSDDQKKKLISQIQSQWDTADSARSKWMTEKEEGLQLYWGIRPKKDFPFPNCANVHVPLLRTMSDTLHSNIIGSIDDVRPSSIIPVGPEDVPRAKKIEKLLNWQFNTQVDYMDLVDKIAQSALIYGIAPVKVRYVIEKEGGKKTFDGLKVDLIPPERFLIPPDAPNDNIDEMEYVIQEIPLSKSDIKKRINAGVYDKLTDEELKKLGDAQTLSERSGDSYLENLRNTYTGIDSQHSSNVTKKYSTILEVYTSFDINDDGIDEPIMVSVLKEQRKILRCVKWGLKRPFALVKFSDIINRATGESVPDLLKPIQLEVNTIYNQLTDAVTLRNIPFGFFDPVSGFNPNEIRLTPGSLIPTNGNPSQAVYFPAMNTTMPDMYRLLENLFEYSERLLGAGANVQGIMQTKRTTATEIATVDRRAGIRFLSIFNRIRRGIRRVFRIALELDREYMPQEVQVRITGLDADKPVFETIEKNDLDAQVDIVINGNSILDSQAEKSEQMQAYQIGMANPLVARNEIAVYELTKDLYDKLGVKRIDAYLKKPVDQIPKTPEEEHNLFLQGEYEEPNLQENIEDHLNKHSQLINSDNFKLLALPAQKNLLKHYEDTLKMKSQLEEFQMVERLNRVNSMLLQSQMTGQVPPDMGMPAQGMPVNGQSGGA